MVGRDLVRADAGRDHQRPGALDDHARAAPASRPGPGRRGPSAARSTATRIGDRPTSATSSRACGSPVRTARCGRCRPTAWSSPTTPAGCSTRARWCCGRRSACARRRSPDALREVARASLAFRKRTQPLASPSAGCIFQNPQPGARQRARRDPAVGRRAGRSRRSQGPCASAARACRTTHGNFIVNDGTRHRRRHRRARRAVPRRRARAVRRAPARGDRAAGRLVAPPDGSG